MYAEFLSRSFKSHRAIVNYIGGVRLMHKFLGVDAPSLYSFDLHLTLRALSITMDYQPVVKLPITIDILHNMCCICAGLDKVGIVLKCVFLLAFFGFLRCSNLVPPTVSSFDPTRHLCRADITAHNSGLLILLKWSKSRQTRDRYELLPLPKIDGHPLCPTAAFRDHRRL